MIDPEPDEEKIAETDRAIAELEQELMRIGVDVEAFYAALRMLHPETFAEAERERETAIGIDAPSALAVARTLDKDAGTDVFLAAMGIARTR